MSIFNSNTKVTVKDEVSRSANAKFRRFSGFGDLEHQSSLTESAIADQESKTKYKEAFRSELDHEIAKKNFFKSAYPNKVNELTEDGRHILFESIMSCLVADSLVLPIDFKDFYKENIIKESSAYFKDKFELLETNRNKNIYLDTLYEAVAKHSRKCASERCKECNSIEHLKAVKFSMTKDERNDFLKDIKGVDFGNITDMVKDKVLAVVKDEQERAEQRKALDEKIKAKVSKDSPMTESFGFDRNHKFEVRTTYFDSLMNNILRESVIAMSKTQMNDSDDQCEDCSKTELDEDNIQASRSYEEISNDIRNVNQFEYTSNKPDNNFGGDEHPSEPSDEEPCDCPECSVERDKLYASSDEPENDEDHSELDNIGGMESCGDKESSCEETKSNCCNSCGADIEEGCVCSKCEEALNLKGRIHKRAKKFQNKVMQKATRESNEVDVDGVMLEAITRYTIAELSHTLNLESFNANKVSKMVRENMKK